jgi:lipopolysaccharide transport system ATP-binding protein
MLLSSGSLIMDGETTKVIAHYFSNYTTSTSVAAWETHADAPGSEAVRLKSVRILDRDGQPRESFHIDEPVYVEISYWMLRPGLEVNAGFHLYNSQGALIFAVADFSDPEWRDVTKEEGVYRSLCCINESFLNEGGYTVNVAVSLNASSAATDVFVEDVVSFDVQDHGGSRARGKYVGQWNIGAVRPVLDWKTVKLKGHNNGTTSQ